MPIKNLTDRQTLKPSFPRLGKLRKGGEKSNNKPGPDLDHFRFTSHNPDIVEAFHQVYGKEPRVINAVMCFSNYEDCFSSWIECWDASGLVFRSDGENWHIWRDGSRYVRGKKAHQDGNGQKEVGRLEFVIPELWDMGYRGTVTLETHSNHDLRNIGGVLLMAEENNESLRGLQFVLRRVKEEISTPGWGEREGKRSRTEKWLVKLEPPRQLLMIEDGSEAPMLASPVDEITGEIIDVDAVTQAAIEDFGGVTIDNTPFKSPAEAVKWGMDQGVFNVTKHAQNAYNKIKEENKPATAGEMARLWRIDVANRVADMEAVKE